MIKEDEKFLNEELFTALAVFLLTVRLTEQAISLISRKEFFILIVSSFLLMTRNQHVICINSKDTCSSLRLFQH